MPSLNESGKFETWCLGLRDVQIIWDTGHLCGTTFFRMEIIQSLCTYFAAFVFRGTTRVIFFLKALAREEIRWLSPLIWDIVYFLGQTPRAVCSCTWLILVGFGDDEEACFAAAGGLQL